LSRACLGKVIIFGMTWRRKTRFRTSPARIGANFAGMSSVMQVGSACERKKKEERLVNCLIVF
jgi:hypothetical protein